jgi:hypothetical protein
MALECFLSSRYRFKARWAAPSPLFISFILCLRHECYGLACYDDLDFLLIWFGGR